jgi:hypothetical protein
MVTFVFWILDMPTHLIFGREIKGKVELRPGHLARECRGGTAAELGGLKHPCFFFWDNHQKRRLKYEKMVV